jgi:HTH-type transcriptional regulator/antitoxin HipB
MALSTVQALSSALRGYRLARGLSQGDVAVTAGVSRKFVSDVESGKDTIEVGKLLALVGALGLALDLQPIVAGVHQVEGSDSAVAADTAVVTDTVGVTDIATATLTRGSAASSVPDLDAHIREYLDDEDSA